MYHKINEHAINVPKDRLLLLPELVPNANKDFLPEMEETVSKLEYHAVQIK